MKKVLIAGILMLMLAFVAVNVSAAAPVLNSIGSKDAFEDTRLQFDVVATDVDNDTLTMTAGDLPSGATFTLVTSVAGSATYKFSWTPDNKDSGEHVINFTVTDGTTPISESIFVLPNSLKANFSTLDCSSAVEDEILRAFLFCSPNILETSLALFLISSKVPS